jgi:molybdopterin molybdotransferase
MEEIITVEKAREIINKSINPIGTEQIDFLKSIKRVLAETIYSDLDFPSFNRSAMDGYACRKADLKRPLTVIEEIPAGQSPVKKVGEGQCSRIMTGAMVPVGADMVIIQEDVLKLDNEKIQFNGLNSHTNISYKGSDIKEGDKLLDVGLIINPEHLALFAGVGKTKIKVFKKPAVAILTTGSEIIGPDQVPRDGKIRNSNGPQLLGQIQQLGIESTDLGIVNDDFGEIKEKLEDALTNHDLVIISGGVSVGDYDYVPRILRELGFKFLFTHILSKPGKHTILAKKGSRYALGLPGNPVSAFVQFEVIGKSLIYKLMGAEYKPFRFSARLTDNFHRGNSERSEMIPVKINYNGEVEFLSYHGSAHIQALAYADALMEIPLGVKTINKGDFIHVRPL